MKIKLDENLPLSLKDMLEKLKHSVKTVPDQNMKGETDDKILEVCREEDRFLITQDLDFSNVKFFKPGTHPGILLVRLQHPGRQALLKRVENLFKKEFDGTWKGCFIVTTDHKVRIRRPN